MITKGSFRIKDITMLIADYLPSADKNYSSMKIWILKKFRLLSTYVKKYIEEFVLVW